MTEKKETKKGLNIPLALPRRNEIPDKGIKVLAGDIGGTKTHLAIFEATRAGISMVTDTKYHSGRYKTLEEIIRSFLADTKLQPERICLGVAGPVLNGKVDLTNLNWELDCRSMARDLGIPQVSLINDLEATAYGLAGLEAEDVICLLPGDPASKGNMAILAPGTGLGEAGLFWNGHSYHPFPTEGGHCDFSPRTGMDMELCQYLQSKYKVVSWESVICGPGIYDIYRFLRDVQKREEPPFLSDNPEMQQHPSAAISTAAIERTSAICMETMDLWVRYVAHECANLVLKLKATGGLFLGGGIPPKVAPLLQEPIFYQHYMDCDRMEHLLEKVPIHIIRKDATALMGAAMYGAYGDW
ncbi:MAG: glucokinase [Candidatus Pseudobacter hemicellulosilyticus]|uniref:Glucokinase n=1 Tax=Candidatus Pseudobacter hemicellulosilyticus TaxID=3121375 RepID=A0AAJ5WPB0_9BACT|nr:MAG: glucokinase [Pseudobacter sp.]